MHMHVVRWTKCRPTPSVQFVILACTPYTTSCGLQHLHCIHRVSFYSETWYASWLLMSAMRHVHFGGTINVVLVITQFGPWCWDALCGRSISFPRWRYWWQWWAVMMSRSSLNLI